MLCEELLSRIHHKYWQLSIKFVKLDTETNRSPLSKKRLFLGRDGSKGILKERASESLNCKEVSTMENMNQQPNKSKTYRVSPDTVAFMLSSGFSTDGSWYQWVKKNRQQAIDR